MKHSYRRTILRGKYLLKAGEYCRHYYFVEKGLFRLFIIEDEKDITNWICSEGGIVTSIRSLIGMQKSEENIQAIEDSEVLCIPVETAQYIFSRYTSSNVFARKLLELYYIDADIRSLMGRLPSASRRYDWFLHYYPQFANRVSLKYIASFLGITVETLSRIRRKKSIHT